MKIYSFSRQTAQAILAHNSMEIYYSRVADEIMAANVSVMYISPGGVVGYHQAQSDQLFLVLQGSGWVTSKSHSHVEIETGQAAFWQAGEWHEAGSVDGMTSVIIEGEGFHLASMGMAHQDTPAE